SLGLNMTFRATPMASCRFRSISFRTSFDGPRRRIVQAFGSSHSVRNVKYPSPIFSISNSPHLVPMSDSWRSSTRLTMVAPVARAMRLLSVLRTRRMAVTFPFSKKCWARSGDGQRLGIDRLRTPPRRPTRDALLRNDEVGFQGQDRVAHGPD